VNAIVLLRFPLCLWVISCKVKDKISRERFLESDFFGKHVEHVPGKREKNVLAQHYPDVCRVNARFMAIRLVPFRKLNGQCVFNSLPHETTAVQIGGHVPVVWSRLLCGFSCTDAHGTRGYGCFGTRVGNPKILLFSRGKKKKIT
jgi:hypothetical protein